MNAVNISVERFVISSQAVLAQLEVDQDNASAARIEALANPRPHQLEPEGALRKNPHGIRELDSPLSD